MFSNAVCNELSWPSRHLGLITTRVDFGTAGEMRSASEPSTTTVSFKKEQFSTAISRAVFSPKGASAFGNGSSGELPAARMMAVIFCSLGIRRPGKNKRSVGQTPGLVYGFEMRL